MEKVSKTLRAHYENRFRNHGATSEGADWGCDEKRVFLRYEKMLSVLSEKECGVPSILDVGCGYGGLLNYATIKGIALNYTGVDVAENMVQYAKITFPGAKFLAGDVLDIDFGQLFDYVVCNGILTQKLDVPALVMDDFAGRLIRRMFTLCKKGVAFNIMTTKVNFYSNNLYYRNPSEMLAWVITEITPYVRLDHSYPLFEYTMYLLREPL